MIFTVPNAHLRRKKLYYSICSHCILSLPPENIRKSFFQEVARGYIGNKWVNLFMYTVISNYPLLLGRRYYYDWLFYISIVTIIREKKIFISTDKFISLYGYLSVTNFEFLFNFFKYVSKSKLICN